MENDTKNYAGFVAGNVGIHPRDELTREQFIQLLPAIVRAMVNMEQGYLSNIFLTDAQLETGIDMALQAKGLSRA